MKTLIIYNPVAGRGLARKIWPQLADLFTENGVNRPITFAYPFGAYSSVARDTLVEMGFRALLTCNEGISKVTIGDPASLHSLKRYNRSGSISSESFMKKVFKNHDEVYK